MIIYAAKCFREFTPWQFLWSWVTECVKAPTLETSDVVKLSLTQTQCETDKHNVVSLSRVWRLNKTYELTAFYHGDCPEGGDAHRDETFSLCMHPSVSIFRLSAEAVWYLDGRDSSRRSCQAPGSDGAPEAAFNTRMPAAPPLLTRGWSQAVHARTHTNTLHPGRFI